MGEGENSIKLYQERFPLDLQGEGARSLSLPPCLWTEQPLNFQTPGFDTSHYDYQSQEVGLPCLSNSFGCSSSVLVT